MSAVERGRYLREPPSTMINSWALALSASLCVCVRVYVCVLSSHCAMRAASAVSLERMLSKRNLLMLHLSWAKAKAQAAKSARGLVVREDTLRLIRRCQLTVDSATTVCKKHMCSNQIPTQFARLLIKRKSRLRSKSEV